MLDAQLRLAETQSPAPWHLDRLDQQRLPLDGSFTYPQGAAVIRIYVVDTGVAETPQLRGRLLRGYSAVRGRPEDDCSGHGTMVATLAAGAIEGVARNAQIVPVRVIDCDGKGLISDLIGGLDWITRQRESTGAVVNISLVASSNDALDAAVERLRVHGTAVVVAAGNDAQDACQFSPGRTAWSITVSASTANDQLSDYSNYGPCVDVAAPGDRIVFAGMGEHSGTSLAAPIVAGCLALLWQAAPSTPAADIRARILLTATQPLRRAPSVSLVRVLD